MEYVYAALILHETDEELNEDNLTAVLESAGADVEESRVKALVAALEDVDIEEAFVLVVVLRFVLGFGVVVTRFVCGIFNLPVYYD